MNSFDRLLTSPWAIRQEALEIMIEAVQRGSIPESVMAETGDCPDETRCTQIRDGVAILSITGPLTRYFSWFSYFFGGASVERLAKEFTLSLNDPGVKSILLNINSPGGSVDGMSEFANMIYAGREVKPIESYISCQGCSAAYDLASAAETITLHPSAWAGSIGIISTFYDMKKMLSEAGVKKIEILSSNAPKKSPDPATNDGREQLQAFLDDLETVFIADVAKFRGVSPETVISDFGQGGVFVGQAAVDAGLVDRLGSFEATLAGLVERTAVVPSWQGYGQGKGTSMSLKDKIMAALNSAFAEEETPPAGTEPAPAPAGSGNGTTPAPAQNPNPVGATNSGGTGSSENSDAAALKAQLDQANERTQAALEAGLQASADAYVEGLLMAGKILPADRAGMTAELVLAMKDDAARPLSDTEKAANGGRTRTDLVKARATGRNPHNLGAELVPAKPGDAAAVLQNREKTDASNEPLSAERERELLSKTPLGRAYLAQLSTNGKGA